MLTDNSEQIADWNGPVGQQWAALQRDLDAMIMPFGAAALKVAAPRPGQRVLDIGCGCGDTSIDLARIVGAEGSVLGVDVSQPMLDVARARAAAEQISHLEFHGADASEVELPANHDLLFSRFGVMFFYDPSKSFSQLRKALKAGGRCVFVCWRAPRNNPWAMTPLVAARAALNVTQAPADPHAPGPFAFADADRLHGILSGAGFDTIDIQRVDAPVVLGATPRAAAESAARIGPVSRLLREVGTARLPEVIDAIELSLAALTAEGGQVSLGGSTWIVSATNPG